MIEIKIEEATIEAVLERCRRLQTVASDPKMQDDMARALLDKVQERFLKQENPDGSKWKPSISAMLRQSGVPRMGSNRLMYTGGATYYASGSLFRSLGITVPSATSRAVGTSYYVAGELQDRDGRELVGIGMQDMFMLNDIVLKRIANV